MSHDDAAMAALAGVSPDVIRALSPAKRALLEQRLAARQPAGAGPAVRRRDSSAPAPLSFQQRLLWLHDRMGDRSSAYNMSEQMRLRGSLDVPALQHALDELVRRHEVLRTVIRGTEAEPVQVALPPRPVVMAIHDLRAAGDEQPARLAELMAADSGAPFDLSADPLLRAALYRLADDEHVLLLVTHHIASDGWSRGILLRELGACYAAACSGVDPALPALPIQYADYAAWQQDATRGPAMHHHLRYWRERLANPPAPLELPADGARGTAQRGPGATVRDLWPAELAFGLEQLAERSGATLYMVLLAAVKTLLYRYTGETDVLVGSPVAGRVLRETEPLIGFFVNTLPLITSLDGDPTFIELLARVRETCLDALEHQEMPLELLVLEPADGRAMALPVPRVMFALQNQPASHAALEGLVVEPFPPPTLEAKTDLTLSMVRRPDGIRVRAEFRSDLFEAVSVERLLHYLQTLLGSIVSAPTEHVSALPLLSLQERSEVLTRWNRTEAAYPPDATLHGLVEAQVRRAPEAIAVRLDDVTLTYRELDCRANQLAHGLRAQGVAAGALVGVCLERSVELVVSLLAVLKAGGAYVPLDPDLPAQRLAFMVADAAVDVVITHSRVAPLLRGTARQTIVLDSDHASLAALPTTAPASDVRASGPAYMIYTSGSTGRPKGALNAHAAICNRLIWMQDQYRLGSEDCVLQKTPFSFDVSVWEFFWPLLAGATLAVAPPLSHRDPAALAALVRRHQVTVMHFVPSMLREFLAQDLTAACGSLHHVFSSGEALPRDLQRRWFESFDVPLHNFYGPTEAAVDVSHWTCRRDDARGSVPIGHPVANTQLYILDERGEPQPVGVPGELYIAGRQVGMGYHRRPELTAERFLPDPFSTLPGARMYRTGDRARYLADGAIAFLGRLDDQVKLRGFRIELGEIEAALRMHPGVDSAAVVADRATPGAERLVGYYVSLNQGQQISSNELTAHLRTSLPDHMIPSVLMQLDQLPLTASGKLDRRALPEAPRAAATARFVQPRTPLEAAVARIVGDVLHLDRVGALDSFFELGGHSLLAGRLLAAVSRTFRIDLPLRTVFDAPTVAEFAAALEAAEPQPGYARKVADLLERVEALTAAPTGQPLTGVISHAG